MASEAVLRRLTRIGQGSITADQGLLALAATLRGAAATAAAPALPQLAANAFIWDTYLKSSQPAFFAEMAPEALAAEAAQPTAAGKKAAAARGAAAPAAAADPAVVREQVKREVAAAILQVGWGMVVKNCTGVALWRGLLPSAGRRSPSAISSPP